MSRSRRFLWLAAGLAAVAFLPFMAPVRAAGKDRVLSKVIFVHYARGHVKPPGVGKDKGSTGDYTYIASSARWRSLEDFLLNPHNADGVSESDVVAAFGLGMTEWEDGANAAIFGSIALDTTVTYDGGAFRGYNTLSFGDLGDTGVIGETTVWGYWTGKPNTREIIEAHVVLNDHYTWGDADVDSSVMDVLNIATHELGHAAGMGDLYDSDADQETMYGYSSEGETLKRALYLGDITGITKLYE